MLLSSCKNGNDPEGAGSPPQSGIISDQNLSVPFLSMTEVSISEYFQENIRYSIQAKSLQVRNKKIYFFVTSLAKVAELAEVKASFYKNNLEYANLTASSAVVDLSTNDIVFKNSLLRLKMRSNMECDKVKWNYQNDDFMEMHCKKDPIAVPQERINPASSVK